MGKGERFVSRGCEVKFEFKRAQFLKEAVNPEHYPKLRWGSGEPFPEIAIVGRSNVGKSSLLNHLFQSHKLVKTSSTPGKTQNLAYFQVDDSLLFVDLPGYGYAKVPPAVRRQWGPMVQTYLEQSPGLKLILFLIDIRREPNEDDLRFLEWARHAQKPLILILTKVDKVNQSGRHKNTKNILESLGLENHLHVHYSVKKNLGRRQLIQLVNDVLMQEMTS